MPGPEVDVIERNPAQPAPTDIPNAAFDPTDPGTDLPLLGDGQSVARLFGHGG